ncbi:MAG: GtrA family protein [Chloroflexota bacterium]
MDTNLTRHLQCIPAQPEAPGLPARLSREVLTFAAIGVVSTAAYALLYVALRSVMDAVPANAAALVITAIGNTEANRRFTFDVRGRGSMVRDQFGGLVALAVALAITTASVNLLAALVPGAPRILELGVLVTANALATIARFVLLRTWIAGARRPLPAHAAATQPKE